MSISEVVVVERRLVHYRVAFYEQLRRCLSDRGLHLRVLHGEPTNRERVKQDSGALAWAEVLPTTYWVSDRICWQPFAHRLTRPALVVLGQENRNLNNLPWMLARWKFREHRLAFWGHGGNLQSGSPDGWRERFKQWTTNRVDWWFAYTDSTATRLQEQGFPSERITVVNNAVDTGRLKELLHERCMLTRAELRRDLGLPAHGPMGLYLGSLYADKRIELLLASAKELVKRIPDFTLAVAGDGPQRELVERAMKQGATYIHFLGPRFGTDKATVLACADVLLHPGALGLVVLEAMAAGLPLVSCHESRHGPEVAYLAPGKNSMLVQGDISTLADAVERLLSDVEFRSQMAKTARFDSERYTIEAMANRFAQGVTDCLRIAPMVRK